MTSPRCSPAKYNVLSNACASPLNRSAAVRQTQPAAAARERRGSPREEHRLRSACRRRLPFSSSQRARTCRDCDAGLLTTRTRREPLGFRGRSLRSGRRAARDRRWSRRSATVFKSSSTSDGHSKSPSASSRLPCWRSLISTMRRGIRAAFSLGVGHVLDRGHGVDQGLAQVGRSPSVGETLDARLRDRLTPGRVERRRFAKPSSGCAVASNANTAS